MHLKLPLAIRKNAEVHERLRREVEVEAKKAGMLQEELEAATLCLEVRKEDHAKREAEWMSEKSRLEQALKEAVAGAKTIAKTNTGSGGVGGGVGFLRNQLSEARQRLENHRAAHGREVALLRKELQLEQRRTESLAREVNLLRVKDSANFVITCLGTSTILSTRSATDTCTWLSTICVSIAGQTTSPTTKARSAEVMRPRFNAFSTSSASQSCRPAPSTKAS